MTLSAAAISLLLRLLEAPALTVGSSAIGRDQAAAGELIASGLLLPAGWQKTFEDQDGVHEVRFERNGIGYSNPFEGWTDLEKKELELHSLDLRTCLIVLLGEQLRATGRHPIAMDADRIFEVGRLPLAAHAFTSIWFARRLFERDALYRLNEVMERRPADGLRMVLTSTPPEFLPLGNVQGAKIVALSDVLAEEPAARIDTDMLRLRLTGVSANARTEPLWVADDGSELRAAGEVITFNGVKQRAIMRILHEQYRNGSRIKLELLLRRAGSSSRDIDSLFRGRSSRVLRYIDKDQAQYTLKLPA